MPRPADMNGASPARRLPVIAALLLAIWPVAGIAESAPEEAPAEVTVQDGAAAADVATLFDVMKLPDMLEVLRTEGEEYGRTLEEEMFPGSGGSGWAAKVSAIYDTARMRAAFGDAFGAALSDEPEAVAAATEFFGSELGARVLTLELQARRALLDDAAEDAAKLEWSRIEAEDGSRAELLRRFAETNDLIESNVMGALNANLAFYRGLADGGALGPEMTEDEMLSSVWSQEADVRQQTVEWLFPYIALAYGPLSDDELAAYTEFSASGAGQALNSALFAAFGEVFGGISQALGAAAAVQMQGQDI